MDVGTAKNSAVALLAASLMVRGVVVFERMPRIQEVERFLEMLKSIGVKAGWEEERTLRLDTSAPLAMGSIDRSACEKIRSSLLLLGALASRETSYRLYRAGGCKLGERTVRPHLYALRKFGVDAVSRPKFYDVTDVLRAPGRIVMYESGDTPTENAVMAAALAPGPTTIAFASANYMVQDLCYFLNEAGADIRGIGTTTLEIRGVTHLKKSVRYSVMPDPIEAMTFIALAATTKSRLTIRDCPMDFLELELEKLSVMGQKFSVSNERALGHARVADVTILPSRLTALPDKLYGRPFPGLNIDNVPLFVPILTQARGRSLVHDWVYENRAVYYLEFAKLGAKVTLLDPHRIFVEGPTTLRGNDIVCPPAIRPATAILIAMLAAKGTSVLRHTYPIERAHEAIVPRLKAVGAHIEQTNE
jgi:UDP-N-acetylglucosamine 1-carboxyvinyltransferase